MSYEKTEWKTGDVITAEKLNKMDNGWGVQNVQLFSETVTTVEQYGMNSGFLTYQTGPIDASVITVTFDGTAYDCIRIDAFGGYYYGGFTEEGPDFTDYPFYISYEHNSNMIYTASAGTYSVAVTTASVVTSTYFETAVNASVHLEGDNIVIAHLKLEGMNLRCNMTVAEMEEAMNSGKHVVLSNDDALLTNATITTEPHRAVFASIDPNIMYDDDGLRFRIDQVIVDEDGTAHNDSFTIKSAK